QVHGGMGYVEETGAAQHLRDARIAPIYEGTNGIQAIDLVTRKIGQSDGAVVEGLLTEFRDITEQIAQSNAPSFGHMAARLATGIQALADATAHLNKIADTNPTEALASAAPYLRLFSLVAGGAWLAKGALHVQRSDAPVTEASVRRVRTARFFAEHILTESRGLSETVIEGAGSVLEDDLSEMMA
ncbi:MAG: acyl-CoA dehydrogenase, partial [Pseudomonadota bacterium]